MTTSHPHGSRGAPDRGFTLVELLIVVVVLGILAVITVFAVRGVTDESEQTACQAVERTLAGAVEVYFAQQSVVAVPAAAAPAGDEYEQTLVEAGLLRGPSPYFALQPDGSIVSTGAPCT